MNDRDDQNDGSDKGLLDKAKSALGSVFGDSGADGSRATGDTHKYGGPASDFSAPFSGHGGTLGENAPGSSSGNSDLGASSIEYGTEMGGGATDTGSAENFDESAGVRSAYDPTTDVPGNFGKNGDRNP